MRTYRAGTISTTVNTKLVVGVGTQFLANVAIGDIMIVENGQCFEIVAVTDDTHVTVDVNAKATGSFAYASLRFVTAVNYRDLSLKIEQFLYDRQVNLVEFTTWMTGSRTGGPNSDGKYPMTDRNGITNLYMCPELIAYGYQDSIDQATAAAASAAAALASKNAAAGSATAANTSKVAAGVSETNAAASATAAAGSATTANTSKVAAGTSETNALASKNAAATSATNAATSETNALASKNAAATSATNAATSETNALTSKNAAAGSATAADGSKTAAATSATNAAASATAADGSKTAAAASATAADGSKTAAATSATNAAASATAADGSKTAAASSATAAAGSAATAVAAAANNMAGFDSASGALWHFDSTVEGWTATNASLTAGTGVVTVTATTGDPNLVSPVIGVNGALYTRIRAQITRKAGAADDWDGACLYQTAGHAFSSSYQAIAANPNIAVGQTAIVEWNMASLSAGGTDWVTNTIQRIRLDLGATTSGSFDVEWIAVGRIAPVAPGSTGGNANLMPADFTYFKSVAPSTQTQAGTAATIPSDTAGYGGCKLQVVTSTSSVGWIRMAVSDTDFNLRLKPNTKYIFSCVVFGSTARTGQLRLLYPDASTATVEVAVGDLTIDTVNARTSVSFTTPADLVDKAQLLIYTSKTNNTGTLRFDMLMLEEQSGSIPSNWVPGFADAVSLKNDKQSLSAKLTSISFASFAANDILIADSTQSFVKLSTGASGRALMIAADAAAVRTAAQLTRPWLDLVSETGDFNTFTTEGWYPYLCNQAMSNSPAALYTGVSGVGVLPTYWYLHNTVYQNANNIIQIAYPHDNVGHFCWRLKAGASWGAWNRCLSNNEKTTSATDTTAGRILQVGAYGWGATANGDVPASSLTYSSLFRSYNDASSPGLGVYVGIHLQREAAGRSSDIVLTDYGNKLHWGSRTVPGAAQTWKEALAVGDFGFGGVGVNYSGNLNSLSATGFYVTNSSTTNVPVGQGTGDAQGYLTHIQHENGSYATQRWSQLGRFAIYNRTNIGGTWSSWYRGLSSRDMVGTCTQVSGAATGSIIERGVNGQGEYIRFADGTQICWGTTNSASLPANTSTGTLISLPVAFANTWFIVQSVAQPISTWDWYGVVSAGATATAQIEVVCRNGATAQSCVCRWMAIGRWY